jgi:tubulin--tyrosine ligase
MTNQARGILVFNQLESLKEALRADGADEVREWVLQRYVHRPLLVGGRKFHLRMYAAAVGALSVHVFPEVLTLFSLEPYTDDPSQLAAHLTNTCCQSPSGPEQHAAAVGLLSDLPARVAAEGLLSLDEASARCARAFQDSAALVGEAFAAVSAELAFMPLPNAFELFGMDLLVDADWHVWLLEANAEPDFVQTGQALRSVVEGVVEGALVLSLDQAFPVGAGGAACSRYLKVFEREDPRATRCGMTFS